jgi:hypothetical protein
MKKTCIFILLLFVVLGFSSCNENDKSIICTIKYIGSSEYWEYECLPEGYVSFVEKEQPLSSKIHSIIYAAYSGIGRSYYYKFKAEKPGEFSLCWVSYDPPVWIDKDNSYVVDYVINENLEIEQVGEQRPIYEIEKYDKLLFEQFSGKHDLHLEWVLGDYPDVTYSVTSDYENRTVDITIYNSNPDDESDLQKIFEDHVNNRFQNLSEVMHDTKINIIFEDSDIENHDSE